MNKGIKLLLLLSFIVCGAQAQVKLGLKAAPLLSWYQAEGNNVKSKGSRIGFSYGLMADFTLTERYFFGSGLYITTMGGKLNVPQAMYNGGIVPVPVSNVETEYNLQYIQVPLSLKFRTKEIGRLAYWAQFGYCNSILIKARGNVHSDNNVVNEINANVNDQDFKLSFQPDVPFYRGSMLVGLGVEYPIGGNSRLMTGLVYDNGFFDGLKDKSLKATHSNISLSVGIFF